MCLKLETVYAIGMLSVIAAGLGMFLPWYLMPQEPAHPSFSLIWMASGLNEGGGGLIGYVVYALIILGENLGLAGCLNLKSGRGHKVPIMFLVGGISTILSSVVFFQAVITYQAGWLTSHGESFSVGFWMEVIAGLVMVIAGILAFRLSPKKSAESSGLMLPPPP
jgi:hypothetical protein